MRRLFGALMALTGLLILPATVQAASPPPQAVAMEMVIVIPKGRTLRVFQQVVLRQPHPVVVGVLSHAAHLRVIGGKMESLGIAGAKVLPTGSRFAVRYQVPWNGHSSTLALTNAETTKALVVLTMPQVGLPPILNPRWQSIGEGRIPGVPNSPVFQEYATTRVPAGERVPVVLERNLGGPADSLYAGPGTYSWAGHLALWLMGILALLGIWVAFYWRPVPQDAMSDDRRRRLLGELAALRAAQTRGELTEDGYHRERADILSLLSGNGRSPDA